MQDKAATAGSSWAPADIARIALITFGVIAAGVTVIAVIESYSNLLAFALAYGLSGWRAAIAPGAVDSFIIMGELMLFAAVLLDWPGYAHAAGAVMAVWGFALSVGGNVWHATSATAVDRAVSAIWPVTATAGLAGTLLIVRQVMTASRDKTPPPASHQIRETRRADLPPRGPAAARKSDNQAMADKLVTSGKPLPSIRSLAETESITRPRAKQVLTAARAGMNGNAHDSAGQH